MDSQASSEAGPSTAPPRPTHTAEEIEAILATGRDKIASPYTIRRSEQSAARHWDVFYSKNQDRFFKDRHWTNREFEALKAVSGSSNDQAVVTKPPPSDDPEGEAEGAESQSLITGSLQDQDNPVLLEVGCGVGNMVWPLLSAIPNLLVHCCDFSPRAVDIVKKHPLAQSEGEERVHPFVFDLTQSDPPLSSWILPHKFGRPTIISLIFVLSAIPPQHHLPVLQSLFSLLAPGGSLIFRDYGRGDLAQLRFHSKVAWAEPSLLSSKYDYYKRGDGTMTFFFSPDYLEDLAKELGAEVEESEVKMITRIGVNRKKGVELRRNFVQAFWKKK